MRLLGIHVYDLRLSIWRLLLFIFTMTLALIQTVALVDQRINLNNQQFAEQLLGADLIIKSSTGIPQQWRQQAKLDKLATAETLEFLTMLHDTNDWRLVSVLAISPHYPLRGKLILHGKQVTGNDLLPQQIWLSPDWPDDKFLKNTQYRLGGLPIQISAQLETAPTGLLGPVNLAPRLYLPLADVAKTDVLQPGSQIQTSLLLAGNSEKLSRYLAWLRPKLTSQQSILRANSRLQLLSKPWQQIMRYMHLAMLINLVLATVALIILGYHYMQVKIPHIALLKTLGMSRTYIISYLGSQLGILWLLGVLLSPLLAFTLQFYFVKLLPFSLPNLSLTQLLWAYIPSLGFSLLFLVLLIPWLCQLIQTPPSLLKNRTTPDVNIASYLLFIIGILLVAYFETNNLTLSIRVLTGFIFIMMILASMIFLLLQVSERILFKVPQLLRIPLRLLCRQPMMSVLQITALTLMMIAVGFLTTARSTILSDWQQSLPANTPNTFITSILPQQIDVLNQQLRQQGIQPDDSYPQVRARLILKNHQPFSNVERQDNALRRDLNLSWIQTIPPGNTLVKGSWWTAQPTNLAQVSIEQGLAERLHLKLGDVLSFQTNTQTLNATLTSIRTLTWESFRPNFYFLFPPGFIQHEPTTYLTSIRIDAQQKKDFTLLLQTFPNLTVINIGAILSQIQIFLHQATQSLGFILMWALLFIFVLIFELKQLYQAWRQSWFFLLSVFGCTKRERIAYTLIEYGLMLGFSLLISVTIIYFLRLFIEHALFSF